MGLLRGASIAGAGLSDHPDDNYDVREDVKRALDAINRYEADHGRIHYEEWWRVCAALRADIGDEALDWFIDFSTARETEGTQRPGGRGVRAPAVARCRQHH